jgi:protein-S-isoprenylcysteine O-methyltransferase Ste14
LADAGNPRSFQVMVLIFAGGRLAGDVGREHGAGGRAAPGAGSRSIAGPEIKLRVDAARRPSARPWKHGPAAAGGGRRTFWRVIEVIAQETIGVWLAFEIVLLVRDRIRGKGGLARDKGTVWLNFLLIGVAVSVAGPLSGALRHTSWYFGSTGLSTAGLLLMWAGLAIRIWAIVVLGRYFRMTVEVDADQRVVETGPYRWVRHPSYSGILLLMLGLGLYDGNWLALLILLVLPTASLIYRISVEEAVLTEVMGRPYADYAARTKRLVPRLW